jgi:hypothetical protein
VFDLVTKKEEAWFIKGRFPFQVVLLFNFTKHFGQCMMMSSLETLCELQYTCDY